MEERARQAFNCSQEHAAVELVWWCARVKYDVNAKLSDRELFHLMPLGDPWVEANMTECFEYMFQHPATKIPDSWLASMCRFREDLLHGSVADPALIDAYNDLVKGSAM